MNGKNRLLLLSAILFLALAFSGRAAWCAGAPKAALPAQEESVSTGSVYLRQCGDAQKARQVSCLAFVAGLYEGFVTMQNNLLLQKVASPEETRQLNAGDKYAAKAAFVALTRKYGAFCPPAGQLTYPEAEDLLIRFIRENPTYADMTTGDLFIAALAKTYPCKTPESPAGPAGLQSLKPEN